VPNVIGLDSVAPTAVPFESVTLESDGSVIVSVVSASLISVARDGAPP